MSQRVVGIDLGGSTARVVEGRLRSGAVEIHAAEAVPVEELAETVARLGLKGLPTVVGVTGRDMILRTTQVPPVPAWQLSELMGYEVDDIAEQSGDELAADHALLGGAAAFSDDDMVLLALVRNSLIEQRQGELSAAGLKPRCFTPNAVALHNAVVATDGGDGTVLVASLRGRNTDMALIQDGELLFARNLTGGGDTLTEAVAEAFGVDEAKAEQAKHKLGAFPRPGAEPSGQAATVARALQGSLRQLAGMFQSTVSLCRSQLQAPDLEVERVLICGPGARIDGLDEALTRALGLPVAFFDPTEGYVVDPELELDDEGPDFAVATGLAMMALLKGSYRIEILSAAAARAREFRTKTLWLVLAGVLLVAYLGLFGWQSRADHEAATRDAALLAREASSRDGARRAYDASVQRVEVLAEALARVGEVTAPGASTVTVLDLLGVHLPDELWIDSLRTTRGSESGPAGARLTQVVVEGSGKELDRDLASAVVELTTRLRGHPDVAEVVPTYNTDSRGRFVFELRVDTQVVPGDDADAEEQG